MPWRVRVCVCVGRNVSMCCFGGGECACVLFWPLMTKGLKRRLMCVILKKKGVVVCGWGEGRGREPRERHVEKNGCLRFACVACVCVCIVPLPRLARVTGAPCACRCVWCVGGGLEQCFGLCVRACAPCHLRHWRWVKKLLLLGHRTKGDGPWALCECEKERNRHIHKKKKKKQEKTRCNKHI